MKYKWDKKYFHLGVTLLLVLVAGGVILMLLLNAGSITDAIKSFIKVLSPVLYGMAIAYLLDPMAGFIRRHLEKPLKSRFPRIKQPLVRGLSIALTLLVFIIILYTLLSMILPQLVESLQGIISSMPVYGANLESWAKGLFENNEQIQQYVDTLFNNVLDFILGWLSDLLPLLSDLTTRIIGAIYSILYFIVGVVISVYILMGKDRFIMKSKKLTYSVFTPKHANSIIEVTRYANKVFGQFIIGKIVDSAIIGVICFICMWMFKFPYAMLISVIVGVTNVIPFFGPYIGAIPSIILILVVNPLQALYFAIFILVLQQIDGNIIGPRILGDATGVEGFWVVVSILVFGGLFGVVGMIIAVPTFAVLSMLVSRWINNRLEKKELSVNTHDYLNLDYVDIETKTMQQWETDSKEGYD